MLHIYANLSLRVEVLLMFRSINFEASYYAFSVESLAGFCRLDLNILCSRLQLKCDGRR
jgi:hypothetical protein